MYNNMWNNFWQAGTPNYTNMALPSFMPSNNNMLANTGINNPTQAWGDMSFLGKANTIYGGVKGMYDLWNSWQTNKLANQQFKFQKQQYENQWNAQKKSVNTALEDRQRARVASNPNAYESVESYMNRNGIK